MMTIVVNAEEKFDVKIPDEEVKNLKTVGDAVSLHHVERPGVVPLRTGARPCRPASLPGAILTEDDTSREHHDASSSPASARPPPSAAPRARAGPPCSPAQSGRAPSSTSGSSELRAPGHVRRRGASVRPEDGAGAPRAPSASTRRSQFALISAMEALGGRRSPGCRARAPRR